MARCADAMGRLSDLNDVSDAFYLEALQKCVSALRAAEHDAEGAGTKSAVADALGVSMPYYTSTIQKLCCPHTDAYCFFSGICTVEWALGCDPKHDCITEQIVSWLVLISLQSGQ